MKQLQDIYYLNINAVYRTGGYYTPRLGAEWRFDGTHTFCQNKFYFTTKGTYSITIDGKEYLARPGSWFFIPAGVPHRYHNFSDQPMAKHWVHFDIYPSTNLFLPLNMAYCVDAEHAPKVWELFEELSRIGDSKNLTDRLKVKAILLNLIAEYLNLAGKEKVEVYSEKDEELRNVLSYINENFKRNLTTNELAAICHMHPTHFIRAFKLKMAQTPHQYVMDIRMGYARQLLDESELSIVEISEEIGFYDIAHFSKVFKRHFSMSPSEYRKTLPNRT